jgi:hypothetical protein
MQFRIQVKVSRMQPFVIAQLKSVEPLVGDTLIIFAAVQRPGDIQS